MTGLLVERLTMNLAILLGACGSQPLVAPVLSSSDEANTRAIEIPDVRILGLSPDGQLLAALSDDQPARLCVYDVATLTERACGDLDGRQISISPDTVVWSPGSTTIAFSEDPFVTLADGDIWTMDATTGALANQTDDGFEGRWAGPGAAENPPSTPIHVDVLPAWAPDGRSIAFSRSSIVGGAATGNELVTVDVASGEIESLVQVTPDLPGVVGFRPAWGPTGRHVYYTVAYLPSDAPENGLWAYDVETAKSDKILMIDPDKGPPALIGVASTGQTGLILYANLAVQSATGRDFYALIDLDSSDPAPLDPFGSDRLMNEVVRPVTFSPDGTRVLFGVQRADGTNELMVRELPDGQPSVVVETETPTIMSTVGGGLFWANDGTVLATTGSDEGLLLHLDPGTPDTSAGVRDAGELLQAHAVA